MAGPLRLVLPLCIAAVACSTGSKDRAPPAPATATPSGEDAGLGANGTEDEATVATAPKSVCTTLDYGADRPNGEYFRTFGDDATTLRYAQDFLAANGMPGGGEVSHDARVTELTDRIYAALRRIYPHETEGLDETPRVVAVAGQGLNAFTGFDERPEVNKAPWILFVYRQALEHPRDAELAGMLAHELGHLVTRNLLPETRAKIRTHYRVPGGAEAGLLGAAAEDEPLVRARAEEIREIGQKVGRHAIMGPVPLSPYLVTDYQSLLDTLAAERGTAADGAACKAADDGLARMKQIATGGASIHEYTKLNLTQDETAALAKLGVSTGDALKKCYANVKISLFELKVRHEAAKEPGGDTATRIDKALDPTTPEHEAAKAELMTMPAERKADADAGRSTIDRLLGVVEELHHRLALFEADETLPIDELRVFDMEEDADDIAVRVLRAIGEDPLANARIWVGLMPDPDACYRDVDAGNVPSYGRFVDPHNDTCWRYYHAIQFNQALSRCPAPYDAPAARTRSVVGVPASGHLVSARARSISFLNF